MAEYIEVHGVEELMRNVFERLRCEEGNGGSMSNFYSIFRREIRKVLSQTQSEMKKRARSALSSDPRKAAQGVKKSNWRKELGGSVSLYNSRTASPRTVVMEKTSARAGQRGGNRRKRSSRTDQIDGYYGKDRAFILRFINQGTTGRQTKYGNRGHISARNFFRDAEGVLRAKVGEMTAELEAFINEVGGGE